MKKLVKALIIFAVLAVMIAVPAAAFAAEESGSQNNTVNTYEASANPGSKKLQDVCSSLKDNFMGKNLIKQLEKKLNDEIEKTLKDIKDEFCSSITWDKDKHPKPPVDEDGDEDAGGNDNDGQDEDKDADEDEDKDIDEDDDTDTDEEIDEDENTDENEGQDTDEDQDEDEDQDTDDEDDQNIDEGQDKDQDKDKDKDQGKDDDNDKNQSGGSGSGVIGEYESQVVTLVNKERAANGLSNLKVNTKLSQVAKAKAEDMRDNNYFSHTSPTYGSPFDMMKSFGVTYRSAGENIAKGQKTPQSVMQGWMNSSGHRANILSSNYTEIGVGYVTDSKGNTYWVQMFITP